MAIPSFKRCFAIGCETTVPRKFLMCGPHWDMVPTDLQHEVYRSFHSWNAGGSVREYLAATESAKLAVTQVENLAQVHTEAC